MRWLSHIFQIMLLVHIVDVLYRIVLIEHSLIFIFQQKGGCDTMYYLQYKNAELKIFEGHKKSDNDFANYFVTQQSQYNKTIVDLSKYEPLHETGVFRIKFKKHDDIMRDEQVLHRILRNTDNGDHGNLQVMYIIQREHPIVISNLTYNLLMLLSVVVNGRIGYNKLYKIAHVLLLLDSDELQFWLNQLLSNGHVSVSKSFETLYHIED